MEKNVKHHLLQTLSELGELELKNFQAKVRDVELWKVYDWILRDRVEKADSSQWLVNHFGMEYGAEVTLETLSCMDQQSCVKGLAEVLEAYRDQCDKHQLIISSVKNLLCQTLGALGEELKVFKTKVVDVELSDTSIINPPIPGDRLEKARSAEAVEQLISHYGVRYAIEATLSVLRDMEQRALVNELFEMQLKYMKQTWDWQKALYRVSEWLLQTWDSLGQEEFECFRIKVTESDQEQDSNPTFSTQLETAKRLEVVEELIHEYGEERALRVTRDILGGMNRAALVQRLIEATWNDACGETHCELCPREKDLPEAINPEIDWDPEGSKTTYRVHIPGAGFFRCSETKLRFKVRAAVTIQYKYSSWDPHLSEQDTQQWMIASPLFNIQVEPAGVITAIHLPHFLCLAGGEVTLSQMQIAHLVNGKLSLEKPTRVRPFHAVLENPHFSLLGVLWRKISKRSTWTHSMVLLYRSLRAADITLHIYLIPDDRSVEQEVDDDEKCQSFKVAKPLPTKPLHYGACYCMVSSSSNLEIQPEDMEFRRRGPGQHQLWTEVYISDMGERVELGLREKQQKQSVWNITLRPGDVIPPASSVELHPGARMEKTRKDHLMDALKNLTEGELKEFNSKLTDIELKKGFDHIPRGALERAEPVQIATLLIKHYGEAYAVEVAIRVLTAINQRDLADKLSKVTKAD